VLPPTVGAAYPFATLKVWRGIGLSLLKFATLFRIRLIVEINICGWLLKRLTS
jgi:hypothetical protein